MVPGLKTPIERVYRGPWILFEGKSTGKISLGVHPTGTYRLLVKVESIKGHTKCSGSISINGTETLDFDSANQKLTTTTFLSSKPSIEPIDLDCQLTIQCVDTNGKPLIKEVIQDGKCRWDESSQRVQVDETTWKLSTSQILTALNCDTGDVIRKAGFDYEVIKVKVFSKLSGREFLRRAWLAG